MELRKPLFLHCRDACVVGLAGEPTKCMPGGYQNLRSPKPVPGQVALAVELRKPLFLHCRDAADAFARILARHELSAPAVVHCFTGSAQELTRFVSMGLHVGITGWVRAGRCMLWPV